MIWNVPVSATSAYCVTVGGVLIAERGSGRLLGAQLVGREGSSKRIDVCAVALWNEMTVEEMTSLDLGYAPPFSPVWDPVLVAARKAAARV